VQRLVRSRISGAKALRCCNDPTAGLFEAQYQLVDIGHEGFAVGVRAVVDQARRLFGQGLFTRQTRPAPDFTIGQQSQPTQITASARELQIPEEILEAELKRLTRCRHVALQQFPRAYIRPGDGF